MSAWLVDRAHIDAIVQAMLTYELIVPEMADQTGRTLWAENLASVAYRYPGDGDGERPGPIDFRDHDVEEYAFTPVRGRVDVDVARTAAQSLGYQSCEHPQWGGSEASRLIAALVAVCDQHQREFTQRFGQNALPDGFGWSVDDRDIYVIAALERGFTKERETL